MTDPQTGDGRRERDGRHETVEERMDRNFTDLLQELRVVQTGTQVLAGFLLTLPFQERFAELTRYQTTLFLVSIVLAFVTILLLVGPVGVHRSLFRQHRKAELVEISHRLARLGLATLGLTLTVVLCLIFTVVLDTTAGLIAGGSALVAFLGLWWVVPTVLRRHPMPMVTPGA